MTMICNNFGIYFPLEEWLIILCSVQNDLDYSAPNGRVIPPLTCNECLKFSQIMIFCCAENCAEQKLKSSKSNKFMSLFPIVIWKLYAVHLSFSVMMKLNVYLYLWKCPSLHFLYCKLSTKYFLQSFVLFWNRCVDMYLKMTLHI